MRTTSWQRTCGFSLIETLVALAILGFGLLAVARFQAMLLENSSYAKQRSEATLLAQAKMEQLRAFEQLAAASGRFSYDDIQSTSSETVSGITSNTIYTRGWRVDASTEPGYKAVAVTVGWNDLKGQAQTVILHSLLAGLDPQVSGGLLVPPVGSPVKKPRNRALNIPLPAIAVSPTKSAFVPPGRSDYYLVFDNDTGLINARCSGAISTYSADSCPDSLEAYLVSGYIRFSTAGNPSASNPSSARMGLTVSTLRTANVGGSPADECSNDSQVTATHANVVVYSCLIYPHDHDNRPDTRHTWSGTVVLALTDAEIGTGSRQYKICRYTFDYNGDGRLTNDEHPATYSQLTESLSNQNYLVIKGNEACPADSTLVNAASYPVNYNTVEQQPEARPYP